MTTRTNIRPYSAGVTIKTIKKPRLRKFDLTFDGPPPPTPEGVGNGVRPHGGYRGMRPLPPGQYTFNKSEEYQQELEDEYRILVNNENYESHGAPYWLNDVQREITNSGESPLFTNSLLPSGKLPFLFRALTPSYQNIQFEQEQGDVNFERAVLYSNKRRQLAPRRRYLNGRKEYYRPNSTHQYLSATDLRNLHDNEENMVRYGRPTRTTLLRARQRTNSAPVNAYDIRRENNRRSEDVKSNSIFNTSKDEFERERVRIVYRYLNIYATEGESVHSFLTGARYNRAHLVDSKGLMVYGVYMPRGHPSDCFITGPRRLKDVGDDIPSAPPDSPRSDIDETPSPLNISRPTSSRHFSLPPSSRASSGRPTTKHSTSRPHSYKKPSSRVTSSSSRPRSAKDLQFQSTASYIPHSMHSRSPPKSPDKKDLPLPDEVTMAMPDHINKGKHGVYVTLKGQKIIESVDSKLPRVTGISLPKIQKPRDYVDEMLYVNQPPPTPCDVSVVTTEKPKFDVDGRSIHQIEEHAVEDVKNVTQTDNTNNKPEDKSRQDEKDNVKEHNENTEDKDAPISKVVEVENVMTDKKSLEIGPVKKVNFEDLPTEKTEKNEIENENKDETAEIKKEEDSAVSAKKDNNVVFFITEDDDKDEENKNQEENKTDTAGEKNRANDERKDGVMEESNTVEESKVVEKVDNGNNKVPVVEETNDTEESDRTVEDVIKVEISETEKKGEEEKVEEVQSEDEKPLTSKDYPFDENDD